VHPAAAGLVFSLRGGFSLARSRSSMLNPVLHVTQKKLGGSDVVEVCRAVAKDLTGRIVRSLMRHSGTGVSKFDNKYRLVVGFVSRFDSVISPIKTPEFGGYEKVKNAPILSK